MSSLNHLRMSCLVLGIVVSRSLLAAPAAAPTGEPSPEKAVKEFYAAYREESPAGGLPTEAVEKRLSKRLAALVRAARAEQERFMKASPDEKPPWIEGDLFSSMFEGATTTAEGVTEMAKDGASAKVAMAFAFVTEGEMPVNWKDDYLLVREDGVWKVDDVAFHGSWDFASHGKLSDSLSAK